MMHIAGNVVGVLGRLRRTRDEIPQAIKRALNPDAYPDVRRLVGAAMLAECRDEREISAVPALVASLSAATRSDGMEFSLRGVSFASISLPDFFSHVSYNEIVDWVAQFKDITDKDRYEDGTQMADAVIAQRVTGAIRNAPDDGYSWLRTDEPGKGALNPTGLAYITGLTGLQPDDLERLLLAGLDAMAEHIKARLPREVGDQMLKHIGSEPF